jgi:hypothetical protein
MSSQFSKYPQGPCNLITQWPGANPGAGAVYSYTKPAGSIWLIRHMSFQLITSATVANRNMRVLDYDGANFNANYFRIESTFLVTASQTAVYSASNQQTVETTHVLYGANAPWINMILPPVCILYPGRSLRIDPQNLQAGDQINTVAATYLSGFLAEEYSL